MRIILEYFIIALFLTFIVLYLLQPKPKIIIKCPKKQTNECYKCNNY